MGRQPRRWGASHGEHRLPPRLAVAGARRLLLLAPSPPARPPCLLLPPPSPAGRSRPLSRSEPPPPAGRRPAKHGGPACPAGRAAPPARTDPESPRPPTPDPRHRQEGRWPGGQGSRRPSSRELRVGGAGRLGPGDVPGPRRPWTAGCGARRRPAAPSSEVGPLRARVHTHVRAAERGPGRA